MTKWPKKDLTIGIASSALFDLTESDAIYREQGVDEYEKYQKEHIDDVLTPGVAEPFIHKLLKFNELFTPEDRDRGVEVIIMSRNSPLTGLRVMNSVKALGLPIEKALFLNGESPARYMGTFNADLFLSANREDVRTVARMGLPAGRIVANNVQAGQDPHPNELRLAFDFDGILAGDSSEREFQNKLRDTTTIQEALEQYTDYETEHVNDPIEGGPLVGFLRGINRLQEASQTPYTKGKDIPTINISLVTARGTFTAHRALNTLEEHGLHINDSFMLAGASKTPILEAIQPDLFFDDQLKNLDPDAQVPAVHVPFGVCNPCVSGYMTTR